MSENRQILHAQDIKIQVTHWFRQMLDCQVQAISLYADVVLKKDGGYQDLCSKYPGFQVKSLWSNMWQIENTLTKSCFSNPPAILFMHLRYIDY